MAKTEKQIITKFTIELTERDLSDFVNDKPVRIGVILPKIILNITERSNIKMEVKYNGKKVHSY